MNVRLRGLKRFRRKGRLYIYHRATGTRIRAEPGTPAFLAELAQIERRLSSPSPATPQAGVKPGSLGDLVRRYRASPEFLQLRPRTKREYEEALAWLLDEADLRDVRPDEIDTPALIQFRDEAFRRRKRHFANKLVAVASLLFNWGKPRGLCPTNPAADVPHLRRPRDAPPANRPWEPAELFVALRRARGWVKPAIALAAFAGLRRADVIAYPRGFYDRVTIMTRQQKTGHWVRLPIYSALRATLDRWIRTLPPDAETMLVNAEGRPLTENAFSMGIWRLTAELEAEGLARPGLTFHGLRHTFGVTLKELGLGDAQVALLLGHADERTARIYTRGADLSRHGQAAIAALERSGYGKLSNRRTATVKQGQKE